MHSHNAFAQCHALTQSHNAFAQCHAITQCLCTVPCNHTMHLHSAIHSHNAFAQCHARTQCLCTVPCTHTMHLHSAMHSHNALAQCCNVSFTLPCTQGQCITLRVHCIHSSTDCAVMYPRNSLRVQLTRLPFWVVSAILFSLCWAAAESGGAVGGALEGLL